jgi:hypothetical protein
MLSRNGSVMDLHALAVDFAHGIQAADRRSPQATNLRSKLVFKPGIGPHSEAQAIALVMAELAADLPLRYGQYSCGVPYPSNPRQKCDLCIGQEPKWQWAIEVKMLRLFGDNGGLNDNILMHILSPYPAHRSALTDCEKLQVSGFDARRAILIYGFDHDQWSMDPAIDAFETLANARVRLTDRSVATFGELVHPVHTSGRVFAWELI